METKQDEKRLAEECKLLGSLLGGSGMCCIHSANLPSAIINAYNLQTSNHPTLDETSANHTNRLFPNAEAAVLIDRKFVITGKRGEKSRLTLAKIVRGIASGDVRKYCEAREAKIEVRPDGSVPN